MEKTKDLLKQLLTKGLCMAVVLTAAIWMFGSFALQAHAATAKVTGNSVNIRKEASTSSDKVGSANSGQTFEIQSEVTGADGKVWYKISFDGKTGFIRSDLAQKTENTTTTPTISNEGVTEVQPISAKVTGNEVRVRPDASTNGSAVTTVKKDAVVTVTGTAAGSDGKTWYRVEFTSGNGQVQGFIREDFLNLAGEIVPVVDEPTEEIPTVEDPVIDIPEPVVEVDDYETDKDNGKWYLVDNTGETSVRYGIEDIFAANKKNVELYERSLKTIKTQKVFIIILVLLLVAGGIGATLLIFKMKDMLDEAYFDEIEKEVAVKRQNKEQNVMHTVGKDNPQKKPTVNGQQRPAVKAQQINGQPKPMPKQQPGTQPKPSTTAQAAMNQQKPAGQPVKQTGAPVSGTARPVSAPTAGTAKPATAPTSAKPVAQQPTQEAKPAATKTNQDWKAKNFMSDDNDDFEFEFLNWDGEDDL